MAEGDSVSFGEHRMTEAYSVQSAVYEALRNDAALMDIVEGIFPQAQSPAGAKHPRLNFWVRSSTERSGVGDLSDVILDFVARSKSGDGDGTELARIFERVDAIVNNQHFQRGHGAATFSRSRFPVNSGVFDEQEKDFFKFWRYHAVVKRISN
jgi:hypothetical protein